MGAEAISVNQKAEAGLRKIMIILRLKRLQVGAAEHREHRHVGDGNGEEKEEEEGGQSDDVIELVFGFKIEPECKKGY